jgi:exonuclease, DNA polymerase III, epsilon subunit family
MNTYVAIDLETTGINPKNDRIIEIGAVKVDDGEISDSFTTFINPQMSIPPRIQELTGITMKMVQMAPTIEGVLPDLLAFCEEYPLLGHNIIFDFSFVKHKAVNQGLIFERTGIDTLAIARQTLKQLESKRLGALCEHYQIEMKRSHRATDDALAAHLLYQRLRHDFAIKRPELFVDKALIHKVKKQGGITARQKDYLNDLLKYHKIELDVQIDSLTKSEASRLIDKTIFENGRIKR